MMDVFCTVIKGAFLMFVTAILVGAMAMLAYDLFGN